MSVDESLTPDTTEARRAPAQGWIEQAPGAVIVTRGASHTVAFVNAAHRGWFDSGDWPGRPLAALPVDDALCSRLDAVFAEGIACHIEQLVDDGDQGARLLAFSYAPLRDENGSICGIVGQGLDVTGLARDSREREDQQRRLYEAILSNTPDLAYVFDLQHRFIYANQGLLRMWGKTWDEAIGKTCLELGYEPWHAAMHDQEIEQVVATRRPIRGEVPFNGTFGRRIYDYIFVPVLDEAGEVEAVIGTTRDVTERQQIELKLRRLADELAEADRRKTEFLAMLAHELRNPLAPLRNALQIIEGAGTRPEVIGPATAIMQRQLAHMVRLVDDLLDVNRISRGSISLQRAAAELGEIVQQAIETCRPLLDRAGQSLRVSLPSRPVPLQADAVRLTQVFSNLLNNASRYSPSGARIELTAWQEGDEAIVSVRDEGAGIATDMLTRIFDMFVQASAGPREGRGGLGIGLALVRSLVELHGGSVVAHSAGPGRGSEFVVRLPLSQTQTADRAMLAPASDTF